ncbi:MAG: hypothetical protein HN350_17985 [Phycisphaerales bacterium]|jgi:hypothetical protein|nr:hypothetical protein [Phycisphaerales bacterium]
MTTRTMKFEKDGHDYIFRYRSDAPDEIIDHLMTLAESSKYNIDWLDAATLSFQITQIAAVSQANKTTSSVSQK